MADMPDPVIGANDVLVRIEATAINLLDSKVRDGEFKLFLRYRHPSFSVTIWPERSSASALTCPR